jgi:hypothetical protein
MLYLMWLTAGLFLLLWMIGVAGAIPIGNAVHFLLLAAMVAIMATLFTRPRTI